MLLNALVFVVALVVANVVGALVVMKISMSMFMNEKFLKSYTKMSMKIVEDIQDELLYGEED